MHQERLQKFGAEPPGGFRQAWFGWVEVLVGLLEIVVRTLDPNLVGQVGPPQTARLVGPTFGLTKKATGYWMWMSGKNEG